MREKNINAESDAEIVNNRIFATSAFLFRCVHARVHQTNSIGISATKANITANQRLHLIAEWSIF